MSKSATLIDNIFINDMICHSHGGSMTSSISDHFFQFCHTDMFQTARNKRKSNFARDIRTFNKREFGEEMSNIDRSAVIDEKSGRDLCYYNFYRKIKSILDDMAPYRKMTQKRIKTRTNDMDNT